jgi:hypothetical protein
MSGVCIVIKLLARTRQISQVSGINNIMRVTLNWGSFIHCVMSDRLLVRTFLFFLPKIGSSVYLIICE